MRLQLYNTNLSPTFKHLMAAFRAAEQERANKPRKEKVPELPKLM